MKGGKNWTSTERHENVYIRGTRKHKLHQKSERIKRVRGRNHSPGNIDVKILV